MGITNKDVLKTVAIDVPNMKTQLDSIEQIKADKTEINSLASNKVDKVSGKGLSTNDYDNTEKTEVAKIRNKADISYVDTKVASLSSVTPVFVNSIAEMGNANKTYINLSDTDTNGYYIYYHNGTQFIKSPVLYQSKGVANESITRDMLDVNVSGLNNNKTIIYYEAGRPKVIVEETIKNRYTRTEIFYNNDGTVQSVQEDYNGKRVTSVFNYKSDGTIDFIQNSVGEVI